MLDMLVSFLVKAIRELFQSAHALQRYLGIGALDACGAIACLGFIHADVQVFACANQCCNPNHLLDTKVLAAADLEVHGASGKVGQKYRVCPGCTCCRTAMHFMVSIGRSVQVYAYPPLQKGGSGGILEGVTRL